MSLRYYMRNATTSAFVDITDRCRTYQLDVTQKAEEGAVGISSLIIDDPDGDLDVGGWRVFYIYETEAEVATQTCIYVGHSQPERQIIRGPYRTGAARQWRVQLSDVNNMLYRRILIGADNDRPIETDIARVQWVISTQETEVIGNTSMVTGGSPETMDANDYLGQETFAVYNDAAQQSGKNFFLTHDGSSGPYPFGDYSMYYDLAGGSNYTSSHRLTNDLSAVGSNTFAVTLEPVEFTIDSSRVASGIFVPYQESYVLVRNATTAANFTTRDLNMPAINVNTKPVALQRANRYLADASTEEHRATLQFHTSRAKVNAIREGMRVPVKMTHWPEPYRSEFTWMRVLSRTVTDVSEQDDMTYLHTIDVSRSTTLVTASCTGLTSSQTFTELGGSGSTPSVSTLGNVLYLRPGITYPDVVTPGHQGAWHFPEFGAGVDYAGDCSQNRLRVLVVGDGTLTVQTVTYSASARNLVARLVHADSGAPTGYVVDETQYQATGTTFTFTVSTHNGVNCTHWVEVTDLGDICGGKWGFTASVWTAS